jgi:hypothetical protein
MTKMALITALLLVTIVMPAYTATKGQMGGGPRLGLTVCKWWGEDVDLLGDLLAFAMNDASGSGWSFSSASRYGFCIGGFLRYDISPRVSIQPELLYSLRGMKYEGSGDITYYDETYPATATVTYKTDYLEIPVLVVLSTADARHTGVDILFGPHLAVKASSKVTSKAEILGQSDEYTSGLDYMRSFDLGLIIGAGFHMANGLVMDARYSLGLLTLFDEADSPDIKNQGFSLSAGLRF